MVEKLVRQLHERTGIGSRLRPTQIKPYPKEKGRADVSFEAVAFSPSKAAQIHKSLLDTLEGMVKEGRLKSTRSGTKLNSYAGVEPLREFKGNRYPVYEVFASKPTVRGGKTILTLRGPANELEISAKK